LLEPTALPALQDPESRNAIRDLASELREHPDSLGLRVRDALDHVAREMENSGIPFPGRKRAATASVRKIRRRGTGSTAEGEA